jgi:integrase/recombinase XerD
MCAKQLNAQVDGFLAYLEHERDRSANTTAAYRNDLTQFTRFIEHQDCGPEQPIESWRDLDSEYLGSYVGHLRQEHYSAATVARKVAAIRSFFHWMQESGAVSENVATSLTLPRVNRTVPRPLPPNEVERLLAEPARQSTPQALRDKAMIESLSTLGMRVSEVVGLDTGDVCIESATIRCDSDGRKSRVVPLRPTAQAALCAYLEHGRPRLQADPGERALFLNHRGQRLTRQGLWLVIKRYAKQIGIENEITPQLLRQSVAAQLLRDGKDVHGVRDLMGHSSARTTRTYLRRTDDTVGELEVDGAPWRDDG